MWQVVILPPAQKFISDLEINTQPKATKVLNLLKEYGSLLRPPHSRKLTGYKNLFELRTLGQSPVRLFYTFYQNKFYILHGYIKKSNKTPIREIGLASKQNDQLTNI